MKQAKILILCIGFYFVSLFSIFLSAQDETTLLFEEEISFFNTDAPKEYNFSYPVSDYVFIRMQSVVAANGLEWIGSNNFETSEECPAIGFSGCDGDPYNADQEGCIMCWDFVFIELRIDSVILYSNIFGDAGTTLVEEAWDSALINISSYSPESIINVKIIGQTWAVNEELFVYDLVLSSISDPCFESQGCDQSLVVSCDDENLLTYLDQQTVQECDTTVICTPCEGIPFDSLSLLSTGCRSMHHFIGADRNINSEVQVKKVSLISIIFNYLINQI